MTKRFTLTGPKREKLIRKLKHLLSSRREIIFVYLFGSFITDPFCRDLDIGVYLREEAISPEKSFDYEFSLGTALEREIRYPVDVKVLNYAPVPLCHSVSGGEVLFSHDEEARWEWVEKTWDQYLDMQHFFRSNLLDLLSAGKDSQ